MRFPHIEDNILATLAHREECFPPFTRLAQEYFWISACRLQARGLCVADQRAGVVRRVS